LAILGVLSLYWAVLYRVEQNLRSLRVFVVDFDGQAPPYDSVNPVVGPLVVNLTEKSVQQPVTLGYVTLPPSQFNNDPLAVREAVYNSPGRP
jgi:hypothetical protein